MSIGQRFKTLLFKLDLTAKKLANELNIAQSTVSKFISEDTLPSAKVLIPLGEKLNVNINWLLFGKGEMFIDSETFRNEKIINGDVKHSQIGDNNKNTINSNNSNTTEIEYLKKENKSLNKEIKSLNRIIESKDSQLKDKERLISILEKNQK